MNGWTIVFILFAIAAVLWILSYFVKDPEHAMQEEFEELSLDLLQDMHILNKRLETMEQELKIDFVEKVRTGRIMDITKKHVLTLYTKGINIDEIVEQIKLPKAAVQDIIDDYITEGL